MLIFRSFLLLDPLEQLPRERLDLPSQFKKLRYFIVIVGKEACTTKRSSFVHPVLSCMQLRKQVPDNSDTNAKQNSSLHLENWNPWPCSCTTGAGTSYFEIKILPPPSGHTLTSAYRINQRYPTPNLGSA